MEEVIKKQEFRVRIIKIIKAYETFCDKSTFTNEEQQKVQLLLSNYKNNELMDKDLDSLKSIYTYLTQRNGISPKIVVKLKTMNFCDKDTLDCLYYKTIPEIEKKKDNTCAVVTNEIIEKKGGKTNRRQKTNRRRLRKTQNKKRR